jgi:hypothetical protein
MERGGADVAAPHRQSFTCDEGRLIFIGVSRDIAVLGEELGQSFRSDVLRQVF